MPRVRATESPKRRTRTGWAVTGVEGVVGVVVVVDDPVVPMPPLSTELATAVVPVVAAMTATSTAPTPTGTTSHARHWLTNVPMRIGRSMRWKETTETAKVTRTRTAKSSYP